MKHPKLFLGLITAVVFTLFISANSKRNVDEVIPRYHLVDSSAGLLVYDAVSGKVKEVTIQRINNKRNIKALLEE